jgi:hypothetical protein
MAEAVACAGAPAMDADDIASIVALECNSALPPSTVTRDQAVNIIASVLAANRMMGKDDDGDAELAADVAHGGGPVFALDEEDDALAAVGNAVKDPLATAQSVLQIVWRQIDVFFFWLSRMSLLIANSILAYDLVAGLPESFGSKKYSNTETDWLYSAPALIFSCITIFFLQPILIGDVAFLSLFLGGDKHMMHHVLTTLHEKQSEGSTLHAHLVAKVIKAIQARQQWRKIEMMLLTSKKQVRCVHSLTDGGGRAVQSARATRPWRLPVIASPDRSFRPLPPAPTPVVQNIVSQMKRGTFNMRSVKLPPGAALFMAKGGAADTTAVDVLDELTAAMGAVEERQREKR